MAYTQTQRAYAGAPQGSTKVTARGMTGYTSYRPNASGTYSAPAQQPMAQAAAVTGQQQLAPPAGIYSPQQTRAATNQAVADSFAQNQPYETHKRFMNRGLSSGMNTARNMLPLTVNGRLGAAQAQAELPFADERANATQQLGTQVARDNESLGLGGLGFQQQSNAASNFNRRSDMGWSLLNQIMGW